jgi:hypothetical protein
VSEALPISISSPWMSSGWASPYKMEISCAVPSEFSVSVDSLSFGLSTYSTSDSSVDSSVESSDVDGLQLLVLTSVVSFAVLELVLVFLVEFHLWWWIKLTVRYLCAL